MSVKYITVAALLFGGGTTFAGVMGEATTQFNKFYVGVEGGYSMSAEAHLQPKFTFPRQNQFFFRTPVNTDWSRDIGSEGFGGAFVGYEWNSNISVQFSYAYRSGYNWDPLTTDANSTSAPAIFDRYEAGNIKIQTFLLDLKLKPSVDWGGFVPYVKGGVGVAINKINGMQNIDIPFGGRPLRFNLLLDGKTSTNFSWNAGVGAEYYFNDQFIIGFGYRFVDTGKLKTSNTFTDTVSGLKATVSPFEAKHIFLHEVAASIAYQFNFI